jgi:mono/diheme cytochrome c family protein
MGRQVFRAQCSSCHTIDGYQSIQQALPTVAEFRAVSADQPVGSGAGVYASECAACHADVSFAEMKEMLPTAEEIDADREMISDLNLGMIYGTLARLAEMGDGYASSDHTQMIDTGQFDSPYMPPFVGTEEEMEALAEYLAGLVIDGPEHMAMKGGQS